MAYRIGSLLGHLINLIEDIITFIFKVLYLGTVKICKRYKAIIFVYLIFITVFAISFVLYLPNHNNNTDLLSQLPYLDFLNIFIYIVLAFIVFCAIFEYIKEYPTLKRRKEFQEIFKQIKLYTKEDNDIMIIPEYLNDNISSEFLDIISFRSLTPLSIWLQKKELLEMYSNLKILDIIQDKNNIRIINLVTQIKQLPDTIMWDDKYVDYTQNNLSIGMSMFGLVSMNLETFPHAIIGGETGSGKSNILKCMIHQSLLKDFKTILIDFKRGVSFSQFDSQIAVYYEYETVIKVLQEMVDETKKRLDLFRINKVDNLNDYNAVTHNSLQRIIIFIDELAELLKTRDKSISHSLNDSLETLLRLSRSAGINVIMGVQRPDSTVISGQIKNNAPYRICGKFVDGEPSRIMLNSSVANTLPSIKGRFIVKGDTLDEVQCFYFPVMNTMNYKTFDIPKEQKVTYEEQSELKEVNPLPESKNCLKFDFDDIEVEKE